MTINDKYRIAKDEIDKAEGMGVNNCSSCHSLAGIDAMISNNGRTEYFGRCKSFECDLFFGGRYNTAEEARIMWNKNK